MSELKKILIIAGSDPSGGAGIQTDIKTATAHKTYSSAVITCLTAQNTQKVSDVFYPPINFLKSQLNSVLDDINYDAIKLGMLGNSEIIEVVDEILSQKNLLDKVVLDPVMVATSGDVLLEESAIKSLQKLAKKSLLITPNIDEAEILSAKKIKNIEDIEDVALTLKKQGYRNILIKGGHLKQENQKISNILLDDNNKMTIIENEKLNLGDIHGTGCSLSTAISCNIANNINLIDAIKSANEYIFKQIKSSSCIGKGSRVLKHF